MKNKRVVITGGAGFIGSAVVEQLLGDSNDVVVIDNEEDPWRLKHLRKDCKYLSADIREIESFYSELPVKSADYVLHLAALAKPSVAEKIPAECFSINIFGTRQVCALAEKLCAVALVNMSALALYPYYPDYCPIDEKHRIEPTQGVYAHSKWLAETSVSAWSERTGISAASIRLSNTYGPKQEGNYLVPSLISKALEGDFGVWNGEIIRDFNFVGDVAAAIISLAECEKTISPMNLGTGTGTSINELAELIATKCEVKTHDEMRDTFGPKLQIVNSQKLQRETNWKPTTSLFEGIERTIEYYSTAGFYYE